MVNVNCYNYTPYIECYAGKIAGQYANSVSSTGDAESGVSTDGTYDTVKLTAESKGSNTFKVYIGAGFSDKGCKFNWSPNNCTMKLNGNGGTMPSSYPASGLKMNYNSTNYNSIKIYTNKK